MKKYLFGVSKYCESLLNDGMIDLCEINGLFDNDKDKVGTIRYGILIEEPVFISQTEIIITVFYDKYRIEAIRQLLLLGYREISIIHKTMDGYEKRYYDFSWYWQEYHTDKLIVLYLQHRSYSGICAIAYMIRNHSVSVPYGFQAVTMEGKNDETAYYYYTAMADYIVTERDYLETPGKLVQLWHGFPLKALGHLMRNFRAEGNKTSNLWSQYAYIASYGQMYTDLMSACYGTLIGQYCTVGMPRNDLLLVTDGKTNLAEIMPASRGKKVVIYMPTFREIVYKQTAYVQVDGDENGYLFYWDDFYVDQLEKYCMENNLYFVFKIHPSDASKVKKWCTDSSYVGILEDEMLGEKCMYEFLNAADVLITDYSSVYFDYLLLDRPIIFTDKDVDAYSKQRGLILEPLEFWRPGAVVSSMDRFMLELTDALNGKDHYKKGRENLIPLVHRYQDAHSTERLLELIKWDSEKNQGETICTM